MKIRNIRVGDRFVFGREGGVWKKVTNNKAACIWGPQKGIEVGIDREAVVYVIREREAVEPPQKVECPVPAQEAAEGVAIIIEDSDEKVLRRIENASAAVVAAYANSEQVRFTPDGEKIAKTVIVRETGFDQENMILHVSVSGE